MSALDCCTLHIQLRCGETVELPYYLGMALHGVIGWTLKPYHEAYQYIYENRSFSRGKQDIVNPYFINPPKFQPIYKVGDDLCFDFVLLGDAIQYKDIVIQALTEKSLFLLGANRKQFHLQNVLQVNHVLEIKDTLESLNLRRSNNTLMNRCSVQLVTPLRIRKNGELLTKVNFQTIIRSITRRWGELNSRYGGLKDQNKLEEICELAGSIQTTSSGLYVRKMERYSTRRDQKMDFSGMLGVMTFEGDLMPFIPWLQMAEIIHIGRNSTFGFGRIQVIL